MPSPWVKESPWVEKPLSQASHPSFYEWLKGMRRQNRDVQLRIFAGYVHSDKKWPQNGDYEAMCLRLTEKGTNSLAFEALNHAWHVYTTVSGFKVSSLPKAEAYQRVGREPISKRLRFQILKRDGYRCRLCGRSADHGISLEIDHKHPVAKGGETAEANLWTLCFDCNRGKSDSLL